MAQHRQYTAGMNTFVGGVLKRKGQKFWSDVDKPSKHWIPVEAAETESEPDEGTDEPEKKAGELVAEIAEMTDVAVLTDLKSDKRKTVAAAAEKRIAELAGPAPGGDSGNQ